MKESPAFTDLVVSGLFISAEAQLSLQRFVTDGEHDWDVDFSGVPTIELTGEGGFSGRPHMLGSTDSNYKSFKWSWSPDNDWGEPVVALSRKVRDYGAEHQIPELTDPEFDADDDQALRLAIASKVITGHLFHVPLPIGPATAWLIVDAPQLELGEPQLRPVVKALAAGLSITEVPDHRKAIQEYARLRGFHLIENGDGLRMLFSDGSADLTFDSLNRLTNCQASHPLTDEAAEQLSTAGPIEAELTVVSIDDLVGAPAEVPEEKQAEVVAEQVPATTSAKSPAAEDSPAQVLPDTTTVEEESAEKPVTHEATEEEPAVDSARPAPEQPVEEEPVASEGTDAPRESSPEKPKAPEPAKEEAPKKKKKGFFGRLFGR